MNFIKLTEIVKSDEGDSEVIVAINMARVISITKRKKGSVLFVSDNGGNIVVKETQEEILAKI